MSFIVFLDLAEDEGLSDLTEIPLSIKDCNSDCSDLKVFKRNLKSNSDDCTTPCSEEKYWSSKVTWTNSEIPCGSLYKVNSCFDTDLYTALLSKSAMV